MAGSTRHGRGKAEFRITERTPEQARVPLWIVALILVAAVISGHFLFGAGRVDPQYLMAVRLVTNFERAKPPEAINYHDPVYGEALDHLGHVGSTSRSAVDASALATDIRRKQKAFAERLRETQDRMDAERAANEARDAALRRAQERTTGTDRFAAERAAAIPAPECEENRNSRHRRSREHDE